MEYLKESVVSYYSLINALITLYLCVVYDHLFTPRLFTIAMQYDYRNI